jgi:hypothetical protein
MDRSVTSRPSASLSAAENPPLASSSTRNDDAAAIPWLYNRTDPKKQSASECCNCYFKATCGRAAKTTRHNAIARTATTELRVHDDANSPPVLDDEYADPLAQSTRWLFTRTRELVSGCALAQATFNFNTLCQQDERDEEETYRY